MYQPYKTSNFEIQHDDEHQIINIEIRGNIYFEEFEEGMNALRMLAFQVPEYSIVFDLKKMKDITAKSRVWFADDFLTDGGSQVFSKTNKCALVMPSGMMAKLIATTFQDGCLSKCPDLNIMQFGNVKKAHNWIQPSKESNGSDSLSLSSLIPEGLRLRLT